VRSQLDRLIVSVVEAQEELLELRDLAPGFGVQEATLRQWISRGRLLAVKRGRRLVSHRRLFLGERDADAGER